MARRVIFVFFGIGLLLFVGLGALNAQYDQSVRDTGETNDIVGERFVVTEGAVHELNNSNLDVIYNETVEVRNVTDPTNPADDPTDVIVQSEGNYTWFDSNGTIFINATSPYFEDGDTARINYTYYDPRPEQTYVRDLGIIPYRIGDRLLVLGGLVFVIVSLLRVWGMT